MAMNGKTVVLGILGLVGVNMAAVLLWPEGKDEGQEPATPEARPEGTPEPKRTTQRNADGSTDVILGSQNRVERVEAARARREAEEQRVENKPAQGFAAFVDDGRPMTAAALERPRMDTMVGGEPDYDAATEAQQRFAAFEQDLLALRPLTPEKWRKTMKEHQEDLKNIFKRSQQLTAAGHNDAARTLLEEWGELQGKYQAQAYGRAPQPVDAPR